MRRVRIIRKKRSAVDRSLKKVRANIEILKWFGKPFERYQENRLRAEKLAKIQQARKLGELEEGIRANKLVLLDIQIERKKLELLELRRKLGNPDDFAPPSDD